MASVSTCQHNKIDLSYTLAYPDGSEVVNVPGTNEPFTLVKYKEELGKGYARITLYLRSRSSPDRGDEKRSSARTVSCPSAIRIRFSSLPTLVYGDAVCKK